MRVCRKVSTKQVPLKPSLAKHAGRGRTNPAGFQSKRLLVISSRDRLVGRYGRSGFEAVEDRLNRYGTGLSMRGVELTVAYVDDKSSLSRFGLEAQKRISPGSVKNTLDTLSERLSGRSGGEISFLILGGHGVVPHFKLANPACDSDAHVFSDNPYGCKPGRVSAEKCLLPELPVGRMPDGDGTSVEVLLRQIETASGRAACEDRGRRHRAPSDSAPGAGEVAASRGRGSFGYTALVWLKASRQVWADAGWSGSLRVSPPQTYLKIKRSWFAGKQFLYFNLHGSDTEPYWFGQSGQRFPTALSPGNVQSLNPGRNVVLTEACYGAVEAGRTQETSMALAFLSSGSLCLVGSTTVAYGALVPPVSEADLIALHFFLNVKRGMAFGRALVNARAKLAAVAMSRQGYLDGDDKKTLLQFVLFGDPTLSTDSPPSRRPAA
jgi:hypothetical protein